MLYIWMIFPLIKDLTNIDFFIHEGGMIIRPTSKTRHPFGYIEGFSSRISNTSDSRTIGPITA
jgi:hypothetical protein